MGLFQGINILGLSGEMTVRADIFSSASSKTFQSELELISEHSCFIVKIFIPLNYTPPHTRQKPDDVAVPRSLW